MNFIVIAPSQNGVRKIIIVRPETGPIDQENRSTMVLENVHTEVLETQTRTEQQEQ